MIAIRTTFRRLLAEDKGATAIEYGLIAALIVIALMGGLISLGGGASGMWTKINDEVQKV